VLWQKTLGGSEGEFCKSIVETNDGGYLLACDSDSNNGDVSTNQGSSDFWIVKLAPVTNASTAPTTIPLHLYPNPAQNWFRLNLPITESDMHISITDAQGRVVVAKTIRSDERLDISALEPGVYSVTAVARSGQVYAGKLVKG
jgi:DNA-binding beta-propeller fold protein YncE